MEKLQLITHPYPTQPKFFLLSITYEKGQKAAEAQLLIAGPLSNCNRGQPQSGGKTMANCAPAWPPAYQKTARAQITGVGKIWSGWQALLDMSSGYPVTDKAFWQTIWLIQTV